jgi:hypothetical protein
VIWLLSALGIGGIGAALFFIPGAMRVATEALSGALRLIRENPMLAIILGLVLACGWLWRADHHHVAQLHAEQIARKADHAAYIAAQAEAQRLAIAARDATERRYKDIAHDADTKAAAALVDARSLSVRYADAHRVRDQAACRSGGNTVATGQDRTASDSSGPGADAIVLSQADFDVLNANTVRLEQVRQWGEALVGAGLAK